MTSLSDLPGRFRAKVQVTAGGHWLWTGAVQSKGYGAYWDQGKVQLAHRVVFGVIPAGLEPDHVCRVKLCVRPHPDHVELVTHGENVRRSDHGHRKKTHCPQGHPYDERNTYRGPDGRRACRACAAARKRERRALCRTP